MSVGRQTNLITLLDLCVSSQHSPNTVARLSQNSKGHGVVGLNMVVMWELLCAGFRHSASLHARVILDGATCQQSVRGLCIATGQYSSLCGYALGLILGGFEIVEVDVQDREQVDNREHVEAREREENKTRKQPTNAQTCDIMDGMWME